MWCKTNGYEMLEENEWAGKWIPVIRVVGNEYEVEGRLFVSGLIRNAKDAQRMYNYWVSAETEMLALAPKAPFIGYGGQFEGYENQWKTANVNNWPYLEVNPDVTDGQGSVLPLPQRAAPPMVQSGLIQAKAGASDDIKSTTGQYDSSLGARSNERSGRAILAREHQSDVGTYHYVDNLARAIRYTTRQIVDMIPKIYDTQRVARIIGVDGGKHEVPGHGRLDRNGGRLGITDFANENDIRVLAQEGPQGLGEGQTHLRRDLRLADMFEVELDRIFDAEHLLRRTREGLQERIKGRGLAAARGSGHKKEAVRRSGRPAQGFDDAGIETEGVEVERTGGSVENAQDRGLAKDRRRGRHPHVDRLAADDKGRPSILRQTSLTKVEIGDDLYP
jgi:hypothetical protein